MFVTPPADSRGAVVSYRRKYVHEVQVNRLGGLSLPRKSLVRLIDRPDMTLEFYRGRKTIAQQQQQLVQERYELPKLYPVSQRRFYNDYTTCLYRLGRLGHIWLSLNQRRLYTDYPTCPNVMNIWDTLGSRCTNVAGSLGTL